MLTASKRQDLTDKLEDFDDRDLFLLLDADTQAKLTTRFVCEWMDDEDREEFVMALLDEHDGKDREDNRVRLARLWAEFLRGESLLVSYRGQIVENHLSGYDGCEDEDFDAERFDGLS